MLIRLFIFVRLLIDPAPSMPPRALRFRALRYACVLLLLAAWPALAPAPLAQDTNGADTSGAARLTLEAIHDSDELSPESFQGGRWAEEGPVVTYIETENDSVTHLMRYNLETGERTRLIDGSALRAEDVGRLIQIEDYQYSADESAVLLYTDSERVWRLNTKGFYYVYDLAEETLTPVADREAGFQMFAKFGPQGEHVAFVRERDLYLVDLSTMEETALTDSGSEGGIINGTSDWVYEEEFGLRDGFRWSPDGQYIAFFQFDESATRDFVMADLREQYPTLERFRYPKAGEQNSEVRVGVIDVTSEARAPRFFDTNTWNAGGERTEYIPQMDWTPAVGGDYHVWMFRMNRDQNDLDVLYGAPASLELTTVLEEESDTWIEVETGFSDLDVGQLTYLDDGERFAWISERDGYRHLYLYERDGTLLRQMTAGEWDVTDFHGVDEAEGTFYFTATRESPLERHLYRAALGDEGAPERITEEEGWHAVNMSGDLSYYIDTFSEFLVPPRVTLHAAADGAQRAVLEGNEALRERLAGYDLPEPEFMQVPGADGTPLNAWMLRPRGFDEAQSYPLLMYVYGGPGSQTVRKAWNGTRQLWHAYLAAERGFVVVSVDNRGTGARGKAFKSVPYEQLGVPEAADQIAAAQHLRALPYIDDERIGIWGWSYGGFMTLNSMLMGEGPETFAAGAAVAPVTDWRQYDTIYTERYMSTPQNNPEGYEEGSPITYADRLRPEQELLIVHGGLDDNVHLQNAVHMAAALQEAGKQFEMMVYPGRNHGIYGGNTRLHLFTGLTQFLVEELKQEPVTTTAAAPARQ